MQSMDKLTKKEIKALRHAERVEQEEREVRNKKLKNYAFWASFLALLIASIGVIYFITRPQTPSTQEALSQPVNTALPPVTAADNQTGPANAKVTLVEYGDFQCPACGQYFPMVSQLKNEYKNSVKVVYRHFPLTNLHKNAQSAAQAAQAAAKQDKFWEMHDLLFKNQAAWSESDAAAAAFTDYASQLGLNIDQFTLDMNSEETLNSIKSHVDGGTKAGIQGTPTFFLNGKQLTNPTTYEDFKKLIDESLRQ